MPSAPQSPRRRAVLLAALGSLCAALGAATIPDLGRTEQFVFDTYGIESGLPGVSVVAACQTRDGYLWLATGGGLARFDGVRFTAFRPTNTPALLSALIYCLCEDRAGTLWIGTSRGLVRRQGGMFEHVGLADVEIHSLAEDGAGRLWIGSYGKGLFVREGGAIRHCDEEAVRGLGFVLKLLVDRSDRLWICTDAPGLFTFQGGVFQRVASPIAALGDRVESICEQPANTFWFGTRANGLFRRRDGVWQRLGRGEGLAPGGISDLVPARDGGLWIVSSKLQRIAEVEEPRVTTVSGVPRDGIFAVHEDREGSLWLCAKERGLVRAGQMPFRLIGASDGLPEAAVRSIAEDAAGGLWLAAQGQELMRITRDGAVTAPFARSEDGTGGPRPVAVLVGRDGAVWMGMPGLGPLRVRRGEREEVFPEIRAAYGLFEDRAGTVWVGTVGDGLFRYRDGVFTKVTLGDGRPIQHATWLAEGPDGAVYAATWTSGFARIRGGRAELFDRTSGLPTDEVRAIHVDREGRVWLGFRGFGLGLWREGACWSPPALAEKLANHVSAIAEDARGRLWLGTPAGVMWCEKSALVAAAHSDREMGDLRVTRINSAPRSPSVWSGSQTVVCATRDQRLLFATREGVLALDPRRFPADNIPPPVFIERVVVEGHAVPPGPAVTLAAGVRSVAFDYTAPSFVLPGQVLFKYRLAGYDPDWIEAGTRRSAAYTRLPPGDYTFRVIACNAQGTWNEVGAQLAVVQRPHFYQTGWFYAGVGVGVVAAGLGLHRRSHQQLKLRLERLEEKNATERERRRIAKNLHDDLGANLTEIGLFADAIRQKNAAGPVAADVGALAERVRALAGALDAIVWSANPANDSLDRLGAFVSGLFQDLCAMAGVRCRIDVPVPLPPAPLTPDERSNLFLAVREALTNFAKHSGATEAWLRLRMEGAVFQLTLEDNGRGFDPTAAAAGDRNGLGNMRSRLEELHGALEIHTAPGGGTRIVMRVPTKL